MKTTIPQTLVVKVGTNVITKEDGELNFEVLSHLVEQITTLQKQGHAVILVSSGAVGAGCSLMNMCSMRNDIIRRQVFASIGQVKLMSTYQNLFQKQGSMCAQVLVTKEDFRDRQHYLNMKNCLKGLLTMNITPVINENDVVSVDELMFTDNDELSGHIAAMMDAQLLVLLTSVDGIFAKGKPDKILKRVTPNMSIEDHIRPTKSLFGRGGMMTKAKIAKKLSLIGITTVITNGKKPKVIQEIVEGKPIGTVFISCREKPSSFKRWVAVSEGFKKGVVHIDAGAEKALREKVASLLPIGVTKIEGNFEKGDVVQIQNHEGKEIGLGIASYDSKTAQDFQKQRALKQHSALKETHRKPLIHYDYLFLFA